MPRGRLRRAVPLASALAALIALIAPAFDPGVQLFYRDTGRLYYPVKHYIAAELRRGHLPLWDPWTEAGTSLLAQVTPGLLHPFTLLYAVLPFDLAFKLNHLLALPLAGLGAFLLARRLRCSRWGSGAAAVAYGGCGYLVSMAAGNLPYALGPAAVPLSIAAFLAWEERRSAARLLGAAAALALPAYAGDPQSMLLAGVLGSALAVARASTPDPAAAPPRTRLGRAAAAGGGAALWGALALALSAPVALPALARLPSTRAHGVTEQERRAFLVSPHRLPGYLVPVAFDDRADAGEDGRGVNPFAELFGGGSAAFSDSILIGAPALLLALLGCAAGRKGCFLGLGALVFALASTGPALGVEEALMAVVPGFRYFRFAEKFAGPTSLLVALAAAVGLDFALRGTRGPSRALAAVAGGLAAGAAGSALWLGRFAQGAAEAVALTGVRHDVALAAGFVESLRGGLWVVATLSLCLAAAALLRTRGASSWAGALGFGCCAAAVLASNTSSLLTAPVEAMHGPFPLAAFLQRKAGASLGRWRLYFLPSSSRLPGHEELSERVGEQQAAAQALAPQYDALAGLESASCYFSALDLRYLQAFFVAPIPTGLVLGVRFFLAPPEAVDPVNGPRHGFVQLPHGYWLRPMPPRPRAFAVGAVRAVPPDRMADALAAPGFSPDAEALIDPGDAARLRHLVDRPAALSAPAAAARWSRPDSEHLSIDVEAQTAALLVVSEHFDPGWKARVDGAEAIAVRADAVALAVPIPPGRHRVELAFRPQGFSAGLWVLGATLAGFAAWVGLRRPRLVSA